MFGLVFLADESGEKLQNHESGGEETPFIFVRPDNPPSALPKRDSFSRPHSTQARHNFPSPPR